MSALLADLVNPSVPDTTPSSVRFPAAVLMDCVEFSATGTFKICEFAELLVTPPVKVKALLL